MRVASLTEGFAIRPANFGQNDTLLEAAIAYAEDAIVMTDPKGAILAANAKAGDLLGFHPDELIKLHYDEETLAPLLSRAEAPERLLSAIKRLIPDAETKDRVNLDLLNPRRSLRCYSGPVMDADESHLGRMWTYRDVTEERRQRQMNERLYGVSIFSDSNPKKVCAYVADAIGRHYGTPCVLSLLRGQFLDYRAVGGPASPLSQMLGSTVDQSYESLALDSAVPVCVGDTRLDPRTRTLLPTRLGYRSFVSVPVLGPEANVLGFLTVLSLIPECTFDEEDARFLVLMAVRVAGELEREQYGNEQLTSSQAIVASQSADLGATREVLEAMNRAFELVAVEEDFERVLVMQAAMLENLLGFGSCAILYTLPSGREIVATPYDHRIPAEGLVLASMPREVEWLRRESIRRLGLENLGEVLAVPLESGGALRGTLLFGTPHRMDIEEFRRVHLEAIAEHVALTLESHAERGDLLATTRSLVAAEADLVRSEKLASVGVLSSVVAHDIKNILAAITMELSIPGEPARTMEAVRQHLDRFSVLSHRLLGYARPRMVVKQRLDLFDVVHSLTNLLAPQMRISDVQLVGNPPKSPVAIMGDRSQLEHMLVAILHNSLQAMSAARGGLIEIKIKRSGRKATVELRDTGPGIAPENLSRVFEPFFSTRHEGFGLGLYAARRIAREHGGDVSVNSTVGVGTTVMVVLQAAADL